MRNFERQNYYELLEIGPEAGLDEITRAYHQALEAFNVDSVAIYSLFDEREREVLVARIEEAFRVLSHVSSRREYDRQLLAHGFLSAESAQESGLDEEEEIGLIERHAIQHRPLDPLVRSDGEPVHLGQGEVIKGADLKKLRESRGVSLEDISTRTRISLAALEAIEADHHHRLPARIYIKGFLEAYCKALMLDADLISRAYLAGMSR